MRHLLLSLMKGDEGINVMNHRCDRSLFGKLGANEINVGDIFVMDMNDRFPLSALSELVMGFSVGNFER
ncbi:hypothetical protein HMPREF9451_00362 [Slackia piriformis YIT 12062]|uniref:Uncharacterized protein n=1 Tax=Slackia piriformis YIT 12062 TaxID=742818 RepID=K0YN19_9ACTN|nr:hypothetical protein HMPREF9451_00362 [Slackia piriformis YIT 12062]